MEACMRAWFKNYAERTFLFLTALMFLAFSVLSFVRSDIAGATATFVMFFLCLIYVNVSRFKRFKGLGFEAELWEDKQKEAADLIDRLQNIVKVYTHEIVMMKVMAGRWGGASNWSERWSLYTELVGQHDTLGQKIDFSPLKEKVYRVMVFDAVGNVFSNTITHFSSADTAARKVISDEFGSPVRDSAGYSKRNKELHEIITHEPELFKISQTENAAAHMLAIIEQATKDFRDKFGVELAIPDETIAELREIDRLFEAGDFEVHPKLIEWADREE
jgi:hypothetical protein